MLFHAVFVMAGLWKRAGHYNFAPWFLSIFFFLSFFPRLISPVGDWMPNILPTYGVALVQI